MPYFLTQNDLYRLIQRELPPGVFPDGAPSAFYHTAEMYSYALNWASAYANQETIYQNFFPQSCDNDNINPWEIKVFGQVNAQGLNLAQRQALLLQKLQAARGISTAIIEQVIDFTIPGLTFEIANWCCGQGEGGWVLNYSQLNLETYLNYDVQFAQPNGPTLCSDSPADWGMTPAQWAELQQMAYTYEVRIYGTTLTTTERTALDKALTAAEPARSTHLINDGLDSSQMLNDDPC